MRVWFLGLYWLSLSEVTIIVDDWDTPIFGDYVLNLREALLLRLLKMKDP